MRTVVKKNAAENEEMEDACCSGLSVLLPDMRRMYV